MARTAKRWEAGPRAGQHDAQRRRVYAWEDRVVGPRDPSTISFDAAQGFVNAVWAEHGLAYPPRVERLPAQSRTTLADASRLRIRVPAMVPAWCLLHEIAHAMTTTIDGESDGHGARFMGVYIGMLTRYLRVSAPALMASARADRIAVDPLARPIFLDD